MAARPRLRLALLTDLARQLRFAPRAAVLRDLRRTLETIQLLDEDVRYPREWILFRLTGYRPNDNRSRREGPEPPATPMEDDPIDGAALRADLGRFLQVLAAQARLTLDDVRSFGEGFNADALSKRWNVSRKTLERWRSLTQGRPLLALRFVGGDGRGQLYFPKAWVESFEREQVDRIARAKRFSRVGPDQVERIRARARRLAAALPTRRRVTTAVATHLARRTGRSVGAIRRAIVSDVRGEAARGRLGDADRALMLDAFERGEPVGELSRRWGVSRPSCVRSLVVARMVRLQAWSLAPRCDGSAILDFAEIERLTRDLLRPTPSTDSGLDALRVRERPDADEERVLLVAQRACVRLAHDRCASGPPNARTLDEAETALRWSWLLRRRLVRAMRAIVVESLEALADARAEELSDACLREGLDVGHEALGRVLDEFRPTQSPDGAVRRAPGRLGGRLAGAVSLVVGRALSEWAAGGARLERRRGPRAVGVIDVDGLERRACPWQELSPPWAERLAHLATRDEWHGSAEGQELRAARLLGARLGIRTGRPRTIEEIAHLDGCSRIVAARGVQEALRAGAGLSRAEHASTTGSGSRGGGPGAERRQGNDGR
mgnify:CR=1 FL=1